MCGPWPFSLQENIEETSFYIYTRPTLMYKWASHMSVWMAMLLVIIFVYHFWTTERLGDGLCLSVQRESSLWEMRLKPFIKLPVLCGIRFTVFMPRRELGFKTKHFWVCLSSRNVNIYRCVISCLHCHHNCHWLPAASCRRPCARHRSWLPVWQPDGADVH